VQEDYLAQLNPSQKEAVLYTEGPLMIIAGAGSGKTRVLTYRIAHLVKKGVDSYNILSLTFTNKAAKEMKERIGKVIGKGESKNLWMGTFHSVFSKILRFEADKLGYPNSFTIYDSDDSKKVVGRIIKDLSLDKDVYKAAQIQSRISSLKNNLITVKAYWGNAEYQEQDSAAQRPQFGKIYELYTQACFKSGAMDFDDLLLKTNELFHKFPEVLMKYQTRFKYVLVDEYQDTNHSQYLIIKALASRFENICVVGDDAQSIYAFRGANIYNILNFQKDYKDAKMIRLEQNYRSTKNIVGAANSIIKHNSKQLKKEVWTDNDPGDQIPVFKTTSDAEEGMLVSSMIFEEIHRNQQKNKDFAILYRTNSQSRSIEEALRKRGIPYRIYGGLSFYQRKEIKDILAYMKLAVNTRDNEALRRVINYPARGIGQTTLDKLAITASNQDKNLWDIIEMPELYQVPVNKGTMTKLTQFGLMIKAFGEESKRIDAYLLTKMILERTGIVREFQKENTPENISRLDNLEELLNAVKEFSEREDIEDKSLSVFMEDVALLTDSDKELDDDDHVSLMTIHQSKGLEYPNVFIVGLEEDLFPSQMSAHSRADLEEERRLFYVALTRAEKKVVLSYALTRYRWGKLNDCEPSRFIDEIGTEFLDIQFPSFQKIRANNSLNSESTEKIFQQAGIKSKLLKKGVKPKPAVNEAGIKSRNLKKVSQVQQAAPIGDFLTSFEVGMKVSHHKFGAGVVMEMEGLGANAKITVLFGDGQSRKLFVKFAKLVRV